MLVKVLGDEHPDGIAVVFDAPGPTFRHELDGDYKGNRKETPDIFVPQIPLIHEVVDTLHIPTLQLSGVEADDVIATLATRAATDGIDVIIVTGDRDSYQLVPTARQGALQLAASPTTCSTDEPAASERTGVDPPQYPEYAAAGDRATTSRGSRDREKTAAKLLNTVREPCSRASTSTSTSCPPSSAQNLGEALRRVFLNLQIPPAARLRGRRGAVRTQDGARGTANRSACCSTSCVPHPAPAAARGGGDARRPTWSRHPRRRRRGRCAVALLGSLGTMGRATKAVLADEALGWCAGTSASVQSRSPPTRRAATYVDACAAEDDEAVRCRAGRRRRTGLPLSRTGPRRPDARPRRRRAVAAPRHCGDGYRSTPAQGSCSGPLRPDSSP